MDFNVSSILFYSVQKPQKLDLTGAPGGPFRIFNTRSVANLLKKHRRNGMSRLTSSRNVQWSEESATNWVYSRAQDRVNLFSLRSEYFEEKTEKMKKD